MSDNVQAWLGGVMISAERHGQACKVEWRGVDRAELDEGVTEVERHFAQFELTRWRTSSW